MIKQQQLSIEYSIFLNLITWTNTPHITYLLAWEFRRVVVYNHMKWIEDVEE